MKRFMGYGALIGIVVAVGVLTVDQLLGEGSVLFALGAFGLVIWPSSFLLIYSYEKIASTAGLLVVTCSVLINMAVYAGLGALVWKIYHRFRSQVE